MSHILCYTVFLYTEAADANGSAMIPVCSCYVGPVCFIGWKVPVALHG